MTIFLTWLHLLAAVAWIGGMLFLSLVLVPVAKREPFGTQRGLLFQAIGRRFRMLVYSSVGVLLMTGPLLLLQRDQSLLQPSGWPPVLVLKVALVMALLTLSVAHDFLVGPRVVRILQMPEQDRSQREQVLVEWSPRLPRLSLLVALGVLLSAVAFVRS